MSIFRYVSVVWVSRCPKDSDMTGIIVPTSSIALARECRRECETWCLDDVSTPDRMTIVLIIGDHR